jgi:hypothetical protein
MRIHDGADGILAIGGTLLSDCDASALRARIALLGVLAFRSATSIPMSFFLVHPGLAGREADNGAF